MFHMFHHKCSSLHIVPKPCSGECQYKYIQILYCHDIKYVSPNTCGATGSKDGLGPATTEGKRKVRPARRDVDAYGQPILFAAGSTQEEAEEMQDDEGQVEQVAARDSGCQVGP